jgi:hypothetical protein
MKNHYTALVQNGFLSKAKKQLKQACAVLFNDDPFMNMDEDFVWYFDQKEKALDFNELYDTLEVATFVQETYEEGAEDDDVIFMNSSDFIILCGAKKKIVHNVALEQYEQEGAIPYYFTKRKVNGKIVWFCLIWLTLPFNIPCYN